MTVFCFEEKIRRLATSLREQFAQAAQFDKAMSANLKVLGMKRNYDPEISRRRSIRLRGYDYSSAGAYFVTICTKQRE